MGSDYPWGKAVSLTPLPDAYTELHLDLMTKMTNSEVPTEKELRPALCLLCGEVMDADGKGRCTEHVKACGLGTGIFFLLQVPLLSVCLVSYLTRPCLL